MGIRRLGIRHHFLAEVLVVLSLILCLVHHAHQQQQQQQEPQFRLPQAGQGGQQFNFQGGDNNLPLLPPVFVPGRQAGGGGGQQQQQQQRPSFRNPSNDNDGILSSITSPVTSFFNRIVRFFRN